MQGLRRRIGLALSITVAALASFATAHASTETVLYRFMGGSDGALPFGGVIADQSGNLFGTTLEGGGACKVAKGCGTVFKLAPDGTETVLYAFNGLREGTRPGDALLADQQDDLFGVTQIGGAKGCGKGGCGTVFEVTQDGTHTILYDFKGGTDGAFPGGALIADQSGNLYGVTGAGGNSACQCGTVFEVTLGGTHSVLYSFQGGHHGGYPSSSLIADATGDFYGTTGMGGGKGCGGHGCGTVFELTPDGTETVLYAFKGGNDVWGSAGGLIFDANGNLYGTSAIGGGTGCGGNGCGTVFELAPDGTETVLSRFNRAGGPAQPFGGVARDQAGNLFGTTLYGGAGGCGTIFEVAPGHEAKAVHSFTCGSDGAYPEAGLFQDQSGDLYGTTESGGNKPGYGTVFLFSQTRHRVDRHGKHGS